MERFFTAIVLLIAMSLVLSCSAVDIDDYEGGQPTVNIDEFFDGNLVAYGIFRDRSGKVIRHFQASLHGSWSNNGDGLTIGTLDEVFWFDDGERQTRVWTMTPVTHDDLDNKSAKNIDYIGTANDVEGEALIQSRGNAIRLAYQLVIPYKDDSLIVSMDDWMYLVAPNVVINETIMSKWGVTVGKVTLVIMKVGVTEDILRLKHTVI